MVFLHRNFRVLDDAVILRRSRRSYLRHVNPALTGRVLALHFDEGAGTTAHDRSGYANHGTLYGPSWVEGNFGKALSFDGLNDYVQILHDVSLEVNSLTVEVWVKLVNTGGEQRIWTTRNPIISGFGVLHLDVTRVYGTLRCEGVNVSTSDSAVVVADDIWHHLAFTYDRNYMRIYVDGDLSKGAERAETRSIDVFDGNHVFGYDIWASLFPCRGLIDESRIYNRALTTQEIQKRHRWGLIKWMSQGG